MLSRVANSLYWMGRYVERAENYARFIDVNYNLSLDLPPGMKEQWEPLIAATGDQMFYLKNHKKFNASNSIEFLAFDQSNPNSIISCVSNARENARMVRENITKETWEVLNELYFLVKEGLENQTWQKDNQWEFYVKVRYAIQLLYGIADATSERTEGWDFSKLGVYLERADKTSRILDLKYHVLLPSLEEVGSPLDFLHWTALLKSVSGFNTYRRSYAKLEPSGVVEFLVLNPNFPRSILFCLTEAEACLHRISGSPLKGFSNNAEKAMGTLRSYLEFADVQDVIVFGLHEYLDQLQIRINKVSDAIHDNYFNIRSNLQLQKSLQE